MRTYQSAGSISMSSVKTAPILLARTSNHYAGQERDRQLFAHLVIKRAFINRAL